METKFSTEADEQLVLVEALGGLPGNPRSTDVNDKRAVRFQSLFERARKGPEPFDVLIGINIAIVFFSD